MNPNDRDQISEEETARRRDEINTPYGQYPLWGRERTSCGMPGNDGGAV
jgi:hypothetical protein